MLEKNDTPQEYDGVVEVISKNISEQIDNEFVMSFNTTFELNWDKQKIYQILNNDKERYINAYQKGYKHCLNMSVISFIKEKRKIRKRRNIFYDE